MNFDFQNSTRLITGADCLKKNSSALSVLGKRCMVVTGRSSAKRSGALADLEEALEQEQISWQLFDEIEPNPLLQTAHRAGEMAREFGAQFIVGVGGGSPLDAAKAVAVFAANPIPPMEIYSHQWPNPALPIVAVGTTAGTGSEVGPFAVMTTPEGYKVSFGNIQTYPIVTFGDPKYTASLSRQFTVSTCLDALAHALESYFNNKANYVSEMFAAEALHMLVPALTDLSRMEPDAPIGMELRERLYYASVLAGYALARCGTCYCHRLSYHFTERHDVPHGTSCAVFLPGFIRRAHALMPEKSARLYRRAGCDLETLCNLIEGLHQFPALKLDADTIEEIVARGKGTPTFLNTAPHRSGISEEEVREILTGMFL